MPEAWNLRKRLTLPAGEIAYDVFGYGPPLILIHGTPSRSYIWRDVAMRLADRFTVYVYDLWQALYRVEYEQLGKTRYLAGDNFSMGDIPPGCVVYRFHRLVPEWGGLKNLERWYLSLEQRPAFKEHVMAIPFV